MLKKKLDHPYTMVEFSIMEQVNLHPLKYALGLVKAAASLNVSLFERSAVTAINHSGINVEVLTSHGKIKAKKIAVCCNAYIKGLNIGIENRIMPCATYIVCTEPLDSNLQKEILPNDYCVSLSLIHI